MASGASGTFRAAVDLHLVETSVRQRTLQAGAAPDAHWHERVADLPPGCPFNPRCPRVQDVCREIRPPLVEHEIGHRWACHFPIGVEGRPA
ncbi:hypothetical protein B4Q13_21745 [Lacticaseibacillus rhamnosus]